MLQAGRKGTTSSTRAKVSVLGLGGGGAHTHKKVTFTISGCNVVPTTSSGSEPADTLPTVDVPSRCSGYNRIFIIKDKSREASVNFHPVCCERETVLLTYLLLWLSGEHKAWLIKPIRTHQSSSGHTTLQSLAVLMSGTQPMDQSKHSHQGQSSSQAFRE